MNKPVNKSNKKKIINDPVYGFINIPHDFIFSLMEHPYFQRLRRIAQLGLTHLVYPGALHTRFHHALGAMHLMTQAIEVLRSKGVDISDKEALAVTSAILLHDIGHGPFSHALERSIVTGVDHEELSLCFMHKLNAEMDDKLSLAIEIFTDTYEKKFLHQLVSSQLDMDRLDYLTRDSFFTGVYEGVIGYDRIIKMLNVKDDQLVVEEKGIYSIEKFIISRRLMYWQVYLHKTVLASEIMLAKILKRAKELASAEEDLPCSDTLRFFLYNDWSLSDFKNDDQVLENYAKLDDIDILAAIKLWQEYDDAALSILCKSILNRNIFKIRLQKEAIEESIITDLREKAMASGIDESVLDYFVIVDSTKNAAYNPKHPAINILFKDGSIKDITEASDNLNLKGLAKDVVKNYVIYRA